MAIVTLSYWRSQPIDWMSFLNIYGAALGLLLIGIYLRTYKDAERFACITVALAGYALFGVSMGIPFDFYLIDEVTAVGDASFRTKSNTVFLDRMENAGALFCSHSLGMVKELCDMGAVLENGELTLFEDVEQALEQHVANMRGGT